MEQNLNNQLAKRNADLQTYKQNLKDVMVSSNTPLIEIRKLAYPPVSNLLIKDNGKVDRRQCIAFISEYVLNIATFMGVEWNSDTIADVAESIYSDYYFLTLADFKLMAHRIKSCYYGKVYGKFSPMQLLEWVGDYAGEWTQCSIDISLSGHDAHKPIIDSREQRQRDAELISINTMAHKLLNQ